MKKILLSVGIPVALIVIVGWALMSQFKVDGVYEQPIKSLKVAQLADVYYGYPAEGKPLPKVDSKFHKFDVYTRQSIPIAEHFDSPMGTENGGFTYNAQGFLEKNEKRGGYHLGDDLNGVGGQDTDFGDPVYAAADGLVVYSAKPSKGWGNVLVIAHRLRDGRLVQTFYSHLQGSVVSVGDLVGRGMRIGSVGSADGAYYAHLHYEIRESDGVWIGAGYAEEKERPGECLNPTEFVASYNRRESHDLRKSVLRVRLEEDRKKRLEDWQSAR